MALEYDFESAQQIDYADLFAFFASHTSGEVIDADGSPFLRTPGMDVSPYVVDPDSPAERESGHAELIDFERRALVKFRMHNTASEDERQTAYAVMLNCVIDFMRTYPADAVLLYNSEQVIVRCKDGKIVFDEWEDFDEEPGMAPIAALFERRELPQPLL